MADKQCNIQHLVAVDALSSHIGLQIQLSELLFAILKALLYRIISIYCVVTVRVILVFQEEEYSAACQIE